MFLSPQNVYHPKVIVLVIGAFGNQLGHEGGALMMEDNALIQNSLGPSARKDMIILPSRKRASPHMLAP